MNCSSRIFWFDGAKTHPKYETEVIISWHRFACVCALESRFSRIFLSLPPSISNSSFSPSPQSKKRARQKIFPTFPFRSVFLPAAEISLRGFKNMTTRCCAGKPKRLNINFYGSVDLWDRCACAPRTLLFKVMFTPCGSAAVIFFFIFSFWKGESTRC